jgi:hypothetical protein
LIPKSLKSTLLPSNQIVAHELGFLDQLVSPSSVTGERNPETPQPFKASRSFGAWFRVSCRRPAEDDREGHRAAGGACAAAAGFDTARVALPAIRYARAGGVNIALTRWLINPNGGTYG